MTAMKEGFSLVYSIIKLWYNLFDEGDFSLDEKGWPGGLPT